MLFAGLILKLLVPLFSELYSTWSNYYYCMYYYCCCCLVTFIYMYSSTNSVFFSSRQLVIVYLFELLFFVRLLLFFLNVFILFPDTCQEYAEISHIWKPNKDRTDAFPLTTQHCTRSGGKKNHQDLILIQMLSYNFLFCNLFLAVVRCQDLCICSTTCVLKQIVNMASWLTDNISIQLTRLGPALAS